MHDRIRAPTVLCALLIAAIASLAVSACGSSISSSSGNASTLLKQTFSGVHSVNSGNLRFSLTVNPSGSRTLTGPISLSFGGPFQSLGVGKLPKSNFNVSISAQGKTGTLGILSTGTTGYVTLQGASYQLPAATFQKLESSFAQLASSPGGGSGSSTLSKIGIHPLDWLANPSVVGSESVGGASTTHIRASVNVAALLTDLNTFLQKASTLGVTGASKIPSSISAATRNKIAGEVQNPTVDVWTGNSDKTVRKLSIDLTLPVTGQVSTLLGGLRSAGIGLTMQYANINQAQTIGAPANVRPYGEFSAKLRTFLGSVQGNVGSATSGAAGTSGGAGAAPGASAAGGAGGTSASSATSTVPAASTKAQRYGECLLQANNDIAKMQRCASLINGQ